MNWTLRRRRWLEIAFVALVIAFATARRVEFLEQRPMWVDESESSINALTILEHGVPVDHYLGLPIYENTLVKRWPGSPEYEFKDISYSDRGMATYHGWLPLYAMAASFALGGVAPDVADRAPLHRTLAELKLRSRIARLPAVFFSIVFLALCYVGGTAMFGRDAGLAALLAGCVHQTQIDVSTTARYYSATVTLSTAAVLCLWLMLRKDRWRDYVLGAFVFVLLFFTHLVTFAAGVTVFCALGLYLLRRGGSLWKLATFCIMVAALTVPWMFATGFFSGLGSIPPARTLLSFPRDLFQYPPAKLYYLLGFGLFVAIAALTSSGKFAVQQRFSALARQAYAPAVLLLSWIVCGYAAFLLLMPAASFFPERLNLSYWGPMLLLGAISCAALCRLLLSRSKALIAAPVLTFLVLALTGHDLHAVPSPDAGHTWKQYADLNAYFESHPIPPATSLFASPNEHLTLTLYTGRPFQSIAPVRKSFLDAYTGEIIFVERTTFLSAISAGARSGDLSDNKTAFSRTDAYRRSVDAAVSGSREDNVGDCDHATPLTAHGAEPVDVSIPIFRGFTIHTWDQWRAVFFYRYANPMSRTGSNMNYAKRLRGSEADLLTSANWAVYYSKLRRSETASGVDFRVLP